MESAVELKNVTVTYGKGKAALEDITLTFPQGSYVAVVGPNGAGKTTLFKAILGLLAPERGRVRLFGKEPRKARPRVAYIPQREIVDWQFPLRAVDVVMMGRVNHIGWRLRPRPSDHRAVQSALEQVGMWKYRNAPIDELSGGQQQRIFIARALAGDASLFLLDEPYNEVDAGTQELLLNLFSDLVESGRSVLVALHDLDLARHRFPEILFLNRSVVAYGPPSEVFNPTVLQQTYMEQVVEWETDGEVRSIFDGHGVAHRI